MRHHLHRPPPSLPRCLPLPHYEVHILQTDTTNHSPLLRLLHSSIAKSRCLSHQSCLVDTANLSWKSQAKEAWMVKARLKALVHEAPNWIQLPSTSCHELHATYWHAVDPLVCYGVGMDQPNSNRIKRCPTHGGGTHHLQGQRQSRSKNLRKRFQLVDSITCHSEHHVCSYQQQRFHANSLAMAYNNILLW